MASSAGRVLIYGGKGALGSICVNFFKGKNYLFPLDSITVYVTQSVWRKVQDLGLVVAYREDNGTHTFIRKLLALPFLPSKHIEAAFRKLQDTANTPAKWVGSIDVSTNESADANILVNVEASWVDQEKHVVDQVGKLTEDGKLDAVLCVAGGWAGGNAASDEFITNADKMWKQSVWPSTIAAAVASKYLKDGGIISLPGAMPALKGTAGMIGYGIAKAAVHQLTQSLASKNGGLPQNSLAVALLPVTLDTPMNRKFMPNADFSSWTKLEFIAELLHGWVNGENRPENGSLMKIVTKDNKTEVTPADK